MGAIFLAPIFVKYIEDQSRHDHGNPQKTPEGVNFSEQQQAKDQGQHNFNILQWGHMTGRCVLKGFRHEYLPDIPKKTQTHEK